MKMKCAIIMYPPFSSDGVGRLGSQNNSNWPRKVCFFLTVLQDSNKLNCISVFSTVSVSCSEYILFIFSRNFPILAWFDCSDRRSRRQYIGELFRKIYLGHFTLPRLNFLRFLPLPLSLSLSVTTSVGKIVCENGHRDCRAPEVHASPRLIQRRTMHFAILLMMAKRRIHPVPNMCRHLTSAEVVSRGGAGWEPNWAWNKNHIVCCSIWATDYPLWQKKITYIPCNYSNCSGPNKRALLLY